MRKMNLERLVPSAEGLNVEPPRQVPQKQEGLNMENLRDLANKRVKDLGECPHCGNAGFARWGRTGTGEQRYRCGGCRKTFTGLTGTPLSQVHHKAKLLESLACMEALLSLREAAESLGVHRNTVFRYRHLIMSLLEESAPEELPVVAETDEAFLRHSFKGQKSGIPRPSYRRGMRARRRGPSPAQLAALAALTRHALNSLGTMHFPVPNATTTGAAPGPIVGVDAVPASDAASASDAAKKPPGPQPPGGLHALAPSHAQGVKVRDSSIKDRLRPFRGVAAKNLRRYMAWLDFLDRTPGAATPCQLLLCAIEVRGTAADLRQS